MTIDKLSIDEKIDLVKGMGSWHTNDLGGKLDSIHLSDGPHGLRAQAEDASGNNDSIPATCFPTASALACSFDTALVEEMASAIAKEAIEAGVSVILGPGVNIKRNPVCGRNFEYFSEDPYLAGKLATEYIKGIQKLGVGTSLKHFAANSQETHRMTSNSIVDERALREIYLRAFEIIVKAAKPATIMASYNLLNGLPACENKKLLTDILRGEWGYEGLVMSDWGACVDAAKCLAAGMDLDMPDSHGNHKEGILEALEDGSLPMEALNRAASNVINLVNNYPAKVKGGLHNVSNSVLDEHYLLAKKISSECAVLLKNENALPLNNSTKVIVIGDLSRKMRIQGGGSSHINAAKTINILDALEKENIETVFIRGYDCGSKSLDALQKSDKKLIDEAINKLQNEINKDPNIPILIFGGLTDNAEGEGYDRESFALPANQESLYKEIRKVTENVIFISFCGSPYDLSSIDYAKAILNMYLGGEAVAESCVDILVGKSNPSGRLAETWPNRVEDSPCFKNFGRNNTAVDDVLYCESLFVGYRYYDTFRIPVKYKFGHGMSYTDFEYSNLIVSPDNRNVSVDVTNVGTKAGKEAILLFINNPGGNIIRANRELRAFEKVYLTPGETKTVQMNIDERAFDIYDSERNEYITVSGNYQIEISKAVGEVILSKTLNIEGEVLGSQREDFSTYFEGGESDNNSLFAKEEFAKLYGRPFSDFSNIYPGKFTAKNSLSQMAPYSFGARLLLIIGKLAVRIMTKAPLNDPEARMMYEGVAEGNIDSVCNQSGGIISKKMVDRIIASANRRK